MLRKLAPVTAVKSAAKVLVCLVAGALVVAGPASAQTTRHVRYVFPLSETFTNEFLSDQCGFEVVTSLTGNVNVSLVYNDSGLIAREVDTTSSGSKTIFSAPSTGQSFSHPDTLVSHFDYGAGATLGSAVTITLTGLFGHAPGFVRVRCRHRHVLDRRRGGL
jgi:hypothetical protein